MKVGLPKQGVCGSRKEGVWFCQGPKGVEVQNWFLSSSRHKYLPKNKRTGTTHFLILPQMSSAFFFLCQSQNVPSRVSQIGTQCGNCLHVSQNKRSALFSAGLSHALVHAFLLTKGVGDVVFLTHCPPNLLLTSGGDAAMDVARARVPPSPTQSSKSLSGKRAWSAGSQGFVHCPPLCTSEKLSRSGKCGKSQPQHTGRIERSSPPLHTE